MSNKLTIRERIIELLDAYDLVCARAEVAESQVRVLRVQLDDVCQALEESQNEHHEVLCRVEKAEATANEWRAVALCAQAQLGQLRHKLEPIDRFQKCPACSWYCCEFETYFKRMMCNRCGWIETADLMRPSQYEPPFKRVV